MKEQELMERYITEAYPNGNVLELFQEVISQEKEKSFKAGLERAVSYVKEKSSTWSDGEDASFDHWEVREQTLEEARELKEGEV